MFKLLFSAALLLTRLTVLWKCGSFYLINGLERRLAHHFSGFFHQIKVRLARRRVECVTCLPRLHCVAEGFLSPWRRWAGWSSPGSRLPPPHPETVFLTFKEPRNRFQGIDSASLCSMAGLFLLDSEPPKIVLKFQHCTQHPNRQLVSQIRCVETMTEREPRSMDPASKMAPVPSAPKLTTATRQCFGSGLRVRIRIGSGFNQVSGSVSGSRRAKMTHRNRKN